MQIADRVSTTDRTLAFFTKYSLQKSRLKIRRPCSAYERSEVVPVFIVQPYARGTTYEILRSKSLGLGTRSGGRLEEISKPGDSVHVLIIRLDRQSVWDRGNTHVVPSHAIVECEIA